MKKFTWRKSCLSVLAVSLLVVSGCGTGKLDTSNSKAAGEEVVELTLMHSWVQDIPEQNVYKQRIEKFTKEYPNIKLKLEGVPASSYTEIKVEQSLNQSCS